MRTRCLNPRTWDYKYYGGRGIKICERWNDFGNFLADMGECPSPELTIERINNDGDYTPENCRWDTRLAQYLNKRGNVFRKGHKIGTATRFQKGNQCWRQRLAETR